MRNLHQKGNTDDFVNEMDIRKFRLTNGPWNELMLNDPWSVGYISTLIELKTFSCKEEWESFYYQMGDYRLKKMHHLNESEKQILNDELLIKNDKQRVVKLSGDLKKLNTQNGRTKSELNKKGKILFEYIHGNLPQITESECVEAVRFRVICETWNGIVLREHNTISTLKNKFPLLSFIKKAGDFDHKYAVDYEVYQNSMLICGIQIKPKSYTYSTPYVNKARKANQQKNAHYFQEFGKPVFDIISSSNGIVHDMKPIGYIAQLIKS